MRQHLRNVVSVTLIATLALAGGLAVLLRPPARGNTVVNDTQIGPVIGSATGAASASNASLPAVAGRTNYLEGFDVTGCGASTGNTITITVTGLAAGTQSYSMSIAQGVTTPAFGATNVYSVHFPQAMPASGQNTAITVNVGSFGSGSTAQACTVYGYLK